MDSRLGDVDVAGDPSLFACAHPTLPAYAREETPPVVEGGEREYIYI